MQNRRVHPLLNMCLAFLITLILAAAAALMLLNRWQLRIALLGEADCTLEYGETFAEPGAEAVFGGALFLPALSAPPVRVQGGVNTRQTGDYTLLYTARYLWFSAEAERRVHVKDTVPPVLTLAETSGGYTLPGSSYAEEGYSAFDNADGNLTDRVERRVEGNWVYYRVEDCSGNVARAERQIHYADLLPPQIHFAGGERVILPYRTPYEEPGYFAFDNADGDLTALVSVSGTVDPDTPGDYELRYAVADSWGNRSEAVRTVTVAPLLRMRYTEPVGKVIYLTFDDGPGKYTQELLDILDRYGVKATFFVVDRGYTDMIAREAAAGHSVGVHSATHDYYAIYASEEAYFADLERMNEVIREQTGAYTDIIRFPGGSSNTVSSFNPGIMSRLIKAVTERGYQYFDWNVSSGDAGDTTDTDTVYRNVIQGVQRQDVSVVLMHDSKGYSVAAVERIILWGLENGYTFLPLTRESPAAHHR